MMVWSLSFQPKVLVLVQVTVLLVLLPLATSLKIAFVGDTGIDGDESYHGYGHWTMSMIEGEGVDLVVDVGDFDYWGACHETYMANETFRFPSTTTTSTWYELQEGETFQRISRQYGRHGGWRLELESSSSSSSTSTSVTSPTFSVVVDSEVWKTTFQSKTLLQDSCGKWGPWDGPWEWKQFLNKYDFDFLGASGNAELVEKDWGSPQIWADHQKHLYELYSTRIWQTGKGICRGYHNSSEPGTIDEYGERYSCFYGSQREHHILFLGWYQGSDPSSSEMTQSIDFIHREFGSHQDTKTKQAKWRYCVSHLTTGKLSGVNSDMRLAAITEACRQHGALIISGHNHIYSRSKLLKSVGGSDGTGPIEPHPNQDTTTLDMGRTMSIVVGMGGYDGVCNGEYISEPWMVTCIASRLDHRGAVIAEFDESDPTKGHFKYMNSRQNGRVEDEFTLVSNLHESLVGPTARPTPSPTSRPTPSPTTQEPICFAPFDSCHGHMDCCSGRCGNAVCLIQRRPNKEKYNQKLGRGDGRGGAAGRGGRMLGVRG